MDRAAAEASGDGAGSTESRKRVGVDGTLPSPPVPDELMIEMPSPGPLGIPGSMLKAYRQAAHTLATELPDCGVDWALLASVGRSESNHARGGFVDPAGTAREPILGPVLNGGPGVAAIRDTDGGALDGDTTWDRAVGPMQFVPGTWRKYGADGNGNGRADPNNIHDAVLSAGRYLCAGGKNLEHGGQLRASLHRYNDSRSYVETVIRWAQAYRDGVLPVPDSDVPLGAPPELVAAPPEPGPKPDERPPPDVIAAPGPDGDGSRPGPGGDAGGDPGDAGRPGSGSGEITMTRPGPPHPPNAPGNGGGHGNAPGNGAGGGDGNRPGNGGPEPGNGDGGSGGGDGTGPGGGDGGNGNGDSGDEDGDHGSGPGSGSTPPSNKPTPPPNKPTPPPTSPAPEPPECPAPEGVETMTGESTGAGSAGADSTADESTAGESTEPPPPCLCPGDPDYPDDDKVVAPNECEWPEEEWAPHRHPDGLPSSLRPESR